MMPRGYPLLPRSNYVVHSEQLTVKEKEGKERGGNVNVDVDKHLGEVEIVMILEKRLGRSRDARQPTIPETEWPTYMHDETSSSSRIARRSSAYPCSEEYLKKLKYSGSVVPAPMVSYRITRYSSTRWGRTCFHTD